MNRLEAAPAVGLTLSARPENVAVARQVVGGIGDVLGMDAERIADLRLAVSEACTNAVVHAYERPSEETFGVSVWVDDRLFHVTVRDNGRGMSHSQDSQGLGLGLPIVTTLATSVEIAELRPAEPGEPPVNEVRMTFVLPDE